LPRDGSAKTEPSSNAKIYRASVILRTASIQSELHKIGPSLEKQNCLKSDCYEMFSDLKTYQLISNKAPKRLQLTVFLDAIEK